MHVCNVAQNECFTGEVVWCAGCTREGERRQRRGGRDRETQKKADVELQRQRHRTAGVRAEGRGLQHRNHANGGGGVHGGFTCSIEITHMVVVVYWWCMNI